MITKHSIGLLACLICGSGYDSVNTYAQQPAPAAQAQGPPSPANGQGQGAANTPRDGLDFSKDRCLMARPLAGDLEYLQPVFGSWMQNWSVGFAASIQAVKYTFGTKKASSNTSAGAGIAFRYYGDSTIGDEAEAKRVGFTDADLKGEKKLDGIEVDKRGRYTLSLYRIHPDCRATTSDFGQERKKKLARSIFSITPTVYYAKQENENDLTIQPALLVGFWDDIVSIGPGFNLTGADTGKVFLLLSLGYGFKF